VIKSQAPASDPGFADLGFAKVDLTRQRRQGFPEVIFCEGKTPAQCAEIFALLASRETVVLATRATPLQARAIRRRCRTARYHAVSRCVVFHRGKFSVPKTAPCVAILSAGTSDESVAEEAEITASCFGLRTQRVADVGVAGLHRLLAHVDLLRGADVLIVVAGMEGALPSVVAGLTPRPVIAVPTSVGYGVSEGGFAALAGMLSSCGSGVTVVNIDNGFGAGFAAGRMLCPPVG
jgi:NCAIR mutase (PurE)-related protein